MTTTSDGSGMFQYYDDDDGCDIVIAIVIAIVVLMRFCDTSFLGIGEVIVILHTYSLDTTAI